MDKPKVEAELDDKISTLRSIARHREFVADGLEMVANELRHRGRVHDLSKYLDDEFAGFARINRIARENEFGSDEYAQAMKRERETIHLHFSRNSHHPEHRELHDPERPLSFLDIIEMVCDWRGAAKGYSDPRPWSETVEINFAHKGPRLSPEQMWLARQVATWLEEVA